MMTFRVRFHRYGNGAGRFSAAHFVQAEDFREATKMAGYMLSAMSDADRSCRYIIADIATDGLRGDEASNGWETNEEFSERIREKAS